LPSVWLTADGIASQRQQHRVQHGPCTYTFILPEVEHCKPLKDFQVTNTLQRDSPPETEPDKSRSKDSLAEEERPSWQQQKLETLESAMENNTQWLQKLENFIQENVRSGVEEIKRSTVHTQTAAMLEMGNNLLSQSAEQTRKLTDVETQVLNQTSRLEIQLLEYLLFTNRLEKRILLQTQEISRLGDKNSFLEQRLLALEARYGKELQDLQGEKQQLQDVLERQSRLVSQLEGELGSSTLNSTTLQRQTDTVEQLLTRVRQCNGEALWLYYVWVSTLFSRKTDTIRPGFNCFFFAQVYCDMKTRGGGWTVLQHRRNGSVDFHRSWNDYKMGFGEPSGEHWLGNDIIHKLTSSQEYSLHIQLRDREGNEAYSHYDLAFKNAEATLCKTTFHLPIYSYKLNHSPIYSPAVANEEKCHHNIIIATIIFHFSDYKISVACNASLFFLPDSVLHVLVNCTFSNNPIASIWKTQNI
uniref:Fibrinogen C-terminal domain-containing protein n=1 Tax=Xiphophorus couchianus TaxID=32473 RepID=A0A3B5KWA0_9TELE